MLLPYHLRLALRSLRRDAGLSITIVVVLAVAAGIFCTALMHYLRTYGTASLRPSLHQVEIDVPHDTLEAAFKDTGNEPNVLAQRQRTSFSIARVLAGSGLAVEQTATFRGRLLVEGEDANAATTLPPRNARFVTADFFSMFEPSFRWGAPWSRADEARGDAVVVLGRALADRLFAGDGVGRQVLVDGRAFRVVGVLAHDQPFAPEWDRVVTGAAQDQLYLPFDEAARLGARPEAAVQMAPFGPRHADLLASPTICVAFWIDLPTPALRDAYAAYLKTTLGAGGVRYHLRDLATLRRALALPRTVMSFFVSLTFLVLVGAGLVVTRLLLAKSLVRQGELSIFRAVGAPRASIMVRQLLEAALLAAAGGVVAMAVAAPAAFVDNRLVADTDIALAVTPTAFGLTFAATVVVGSVAALYPAWRAASRRPTTTLMRT